MKKDKVKNLAEFGRWVKIRLVEKEISQRELAKQMDIPHARISEASIDVEGIEWWGRYKETICYIV